MSETGPSLSVVSSWVDLSTEVSSGVYNLTAEVSSFTPILPPARVTPVPFGSDQDYMRMLKEAQKETSCRSSARVSPLTSTFVSQHSTPCHSPKSPPNSPRTELADTSSELQGVFINRVKDDALTDFMWDWSSTPCPPKEWKTRTSTSSSIISKAASRKKASRGSTYSNLYTFLLTNLVSLVVGAGLGVWFYRRGSTLFGLRTTTL